MNRREFLISGIAALACPFSSRSDVMDDFRRRLVEKVKDEFRRHEFDDSDSANRFIEMEVSDWAHKYVASGDIPDLKIACCSVYGWRYLICGYGNMSEDKFRVIEFRQDMDSDKDVEEAEAVTCP